MSRAGGGVGAASPAGRNGGAGAGPAGGPTDVLAGAPSSGGMAGSTTGSGPEVVNGAPEEENSGPDRARSARETTGSVNGAAAVPGAAGSLLRSKKPLPPARPAAPVLGARPRRATRSSK